MIGWYIFWTLCLLVAGASFALITAIVTLRGVLDLTRLLAELRKQGKAADA